ncbi:hypothetical protein V1512DRAFT_260399 [Lipomyces arxii]|uniref:uncharacterized protein n=1 Tax=Lipomyces arxii TaxID=56418 RepID=UPI0034CE0319
MAKKLFKEVENAESLSSLSGLRKKIRDLERLLNRAQEKGESKNTTAMARREQERALRALKDEFQRAEQNKTDRRLDQRYRQVRFFERRKAVRRLEKARKMLSKNEDKTEKKRLEKDLRLAETELAYIALFPKDKKYVSLYVDDGVKSATSSQPPKSNTDKLRREWWLEVSKMVKEAAVDIGSLTFGQPSQERPSRSTAEAQVEKAYEHEESEEDEFFEK